MTDPEIRRQELHRRVSHRYLSAPGDYWANAVDPEHHARVHQIRELLVATDKAMDTEGIPQTTRDRIVGRLLFGEPPAAYEAPDWRDAQKRFADRQAAMQRAMTGAAWITIRKEELR